VILDGEDQRRQIRGVEVTTHPGSRIARTY
jgi:hypothetical protein